MGASSPTCAAKDNNKDRLDLWAYDIARHEHRLLVDSAVLEPQAHALSAEEEARRERQRTSSLSGIVEYEFSSDSRYLLVPVGGDLYVYDLQATPEKAVRRLTSGGRYETDAHFSPHGSYVSFIRDQNLVVYDLATSTERPITRDGGGLISYGTAEFIAQEEMSRTTGYWWSPDEKSIAFTRVDESPVAEVDRFEIYADSVKVIKQRYPAAGARNAMVQLFVQSTGRAGPADRAAVQVDLGTNPDIYLARVNWLPHSDSLAVQRQSRDQKTLTLLKADATSGKTTTLLTEHSDTWVDLHDELTFLGHSPRFIWASSRTGFKHLYLYDLDGKLIRPLTSGEWQVTADGESTRAIAGVDEKQRPRLLHGEHRVAPGAAPLLHIPERRTRHPASDHRRRRLARCHHVEGHEGIPGHFLNTRPTAFSDTALERRENTRGTRPERAHPGPPVRPLPVGAPADRVRHAESERWRNALLPDHQTPRSRAG